MLQINLPMQQIHPIFVSLLASFDWAEQELQGLTKLREDQEQAHWQWLSLEMLI